MCSTDYGAFIKMEQFYYFWLHFSLHANRTAVYPVTLTKTNFT
jgi:hypothetical protein